MKLTESQLRKLIKDATKGRRSLGEAEIEIRPIAENTRGEDFEIFVANGDQLGRHQRDELRRAVAPILGAYSLSY